MAMMMNGVKPIPAEGDFYRHLLPEQEGKDENTACHLGKNRRNGGAGDAHVKKEDEHGIQDDV